MHKRLESIIGSGGYCQGTDGVYARPFCMSETQLKEHSIREKEATLSYKDYLSTIAFNHSIPVMDKEVKRFLARIPEGGVVLDIGGCWGWHWRNLASMRPDVGVLIIDFVRPNLVHAQRLLQGLSGTRIALLHADATNLPFFDAGNDGFEGFDAIWSVQVLQHIPDFRLACSEANRVLKVGGLFVNYSLHTTPFNHFIYRIAGKTFHINGFRPDSYYLARASVQQRNIVSSVFNTKVWDRYTECLFHPDLKIVFSGQEGSWIGKLDVLLSSLPWIGWLFGRQRSFEACKALSV